MRMVVVAATVVIAIVATVSGCAPLGPQLYSGPYRVSPGPELYGGPYRGLPLEPERYGGPYPARRLTPSPNHTRGRRPGPSYGRPYEQGYEPNRGYYGR